MYKTLGLVLATVVLSGCFSSSNSSGGNNNVELPSFTEFVKKTVRDDTTLANRPHEVNSTEFRFDSDNDPKAFDDLI